jgi:hypothetical protein
VNNESREWSETTRMEARYANCFRAGRNEFEMIIDFAQCSSDDLPIVPHTRIVLHPEYCKRLIAVLRAAIEEES